MSIATAGLEIVQGSTFRQSLVCSLADQSIASIQTWATSGFTFALSVGLKGDSNYKAVCQGTASAATNTLTLDIDEAITGAITDLEGRWTLEASNGTDRFRIADGAWWLRRDVA